MKWQNLRRNKCPDCGTDLETHGHLKTILFCKACPFKIGLVVGKMEDLVAKMNEQDLAGRARGKARTDGWGRFDDVSESGQDMHRSDVDQ